MELPDYDRKNVEAFFAACLPMKDAYRHSSFSYAAIRKGEDLVLIQGRLRLSILPWATKAAQFVSKSLCARHHLLGEFGGDAETLVTSVLSGSLKTANGNLRLLPGNSGGYGTHYTPFHEEGLRAQNRLNVLAIYGAQPEAYIQQPQLDWELKAAERPYDSLADLLIEYGLGAYRSDGFRIEVVADTVAFIHGSSTVSEGRAKIGIVAAEGLDIKNVTLGYRLLDGTQVVGRARVSGADMKWESRDGFQRGETEIDASAGGVVHCIVSYAGIAQHHYWLTDPARLPNAQRTAYEAFDSDLASIKEILDSAEGRSYQARDLEAAVAWVLWMHGFLVVHLGGTQRVQIPGPDIIAMTPQTGNFAIIECTTKHLGSDKKLPDLVANAEKLRRKLDAAGQGHRTILKVLVTTLRSEDIAAEREDAERLGVLVLTRENIENALNRSIVVPNPEQMYTEALEAVRTALAKYAAQPSLPGIIGQS